MASPVQLKVCWSKAHRMLVRALSVAAHNIRNIGIVAHVDAGKTTVTESILHQTGQIRSPGRIKDGSTTTDFLECEQNRGITINSAFVQTSWKDIQLNIIDTPGHIDFNIEVERALKVLDGAVVVIDGTRGVEPQTVTVWNQLRKFNIPKVVFLNKFDRETRDLAGSLESLSSAFNVEPLLLNEGIYNSSDELEDITDYEDGNLLSNLLETLALYDDEMEKKYCSYDNGTISKADIVRSMKNVMAKSESLVPVCVGSGYTGVGIPFLLEVITTLLPSSYEVLQKLPPPLHEETCGVVFKSSYDRQKGVVCQSRLYSGRIKQGQRLYNTRTKSTGIVNSVHRIKAGEYQGIDSFEAGEIALLTGCKEFRTGDVFLSDVSPAKNKALAQHCHSTDILNSTIQFSQPLFFCKIEPRSVSQQPQLETALKMMSFEDPTVRAKVNSNGEVVLAGTGQLHLNVIQERLSQEYGLDCFLRSIRVAYRESVIDSFIQTFNDRSISLQGTLSVSPSEGCPSITIRCQLAIPEEFRVQVRRSLMSFQATGPLIGLPLSNVDINLDITSFGENVKEKDILMALKRMVRKAFKDNISMLVLAEPYAKVNVTGPQMAADQIISDFVGRIGSPEYEVSFLQEHQFTFCGFAPLSKLSNYSSDVQRVTNGAASLRSIDLDDYRPLSPPENKALLEGFKSGEIWL